MKTATLEVRGLISMLDFLAVEKRLRIIPGVLDAVMNPAGETATVTFDEGRTDTAAIRRAIDECGFHDRGEQAPRHVCVPESTTVPAERPRAPHGERSRPRPSSTAFQWRRKAGPRTRSDWP